ncbi:MAG: hypothetical protein IKC65_00450 [Lentisphaeria bacterium]|nr:hypothetical protein [Lentisphaeria bacterium]
MSTTHLIRKTFEKNGGIFRLAPAWVPRSFCIPGRRIKLHPDDYYALGSRRGGIDERWLGSTTLAENGPLTGKNEGISHLVADDGSLIPLTEAVELLGAELIGRRLWDKYRRWPVYSKFFDNLGPLPHHIHHRETHAQNVGQHGKPECYYFPPQLNNHGGRFPYTFFGLEPGTSREEIRACLVNFTRGDNKITNYSKAYRLEPGTGWDVPPGLLHAPGSLCTYEPQFASDVFAMYQSLVDDQIIPEELLWKNTPENRIGDFDYLMDVIDWELNVDPEFVKNRFMRPVPSDDAVPGTDDKWICYRSDAVSAKELTILPGREAVIRDSAAYGLIMLQGHGTLNGHKLETPSLIRFGQLTFDEYFVSEEAARKGVRIVNGSTADPIVMLKHFGPENPDHIRQFGKEIKNRFCI